MGATGGGMPKKRAEGQCVVHRTRYPGVHILQLAAEDDGSVTVAAHKRHKKHEYGNGLSCARRFDAYLLLAGSPVNGS